MHAYWQDREGLNLESGWRRLRKWLETVADGYESEFLRIRAAHFTGAGRYPYRDTGNRVPPWDAKHFWVFGCRATETR